MRGLMAIVERYRWLASSVILAIFFVLLVANRGVPALRHDWYWPRQPELVADMWAAATSGWRIDGLGGPNPYINDYIVALFAVPVGLLFGVRFAFLAFLFAIAIGVALSARKLALDAGGGQGVAVVAAGFGLFNPWAYTQIVAGHVFMVAAYAATMALLAEALRQSPRSNVCACAIGFTVPQLQFFFPALLVALGLVIARRMWLPITTWVVLGAPSLLGIALSSKDLESTPLTLAWERMQSIAPFKAMLLSGYFARYTDAFDKVAIWAMVLVIALSVAVLFARPRVALVVVTAFVTAALMLVAMGLKGPLAGVLDFLITRLPALGLYRELYDLLGFVAIGYLILAVAATRGTRSPGYVFAAAVVLLMCSWVLSPPTRFWTDLFRLPNVNVSAEPNTRIAFLPIYQPLQFLGRYSGLDPDARARPEQAHVLNTATPSWPMDVALSSFALTGSTESLAALSVSEIAARPWYENDPRELGEQLALQPPAPLVRPAKSFVMHIVPESEVALAPWPDAVSVANRIGANAVFFGDVAGLQSDGLDGKWRVYTRPRPIAPPKTYTSAPDGWVDARLAFPVEPDLGQGFGGALTMSATASLPVDGGDDILVFVRGALLDASGRQVASNTRGYHWISLPVDAKSLYCRGLCVVALEGQVPHDLRENAPPGHVRPVAFERFEPWLFKVTLAPGPRAALRLNERYDDHWVAFSNPPAVAHVRLDGAVNAWLEPSRPNTETIWLIQWVALVQASIEVGAAGWLAFILVGVTVQMIRSAQQPQRQV